MLRLLEVKWNITWTPGRFAQESSPAAFRLAFHVACALRMCYMKWPILPGRGPSLGNEVLGPGTFSGTPGAGEILSPGPLSSTHLRTIDDIKARKDKLLEFYTKSETGKAADKCHTLIQAKYGAA